MKSNKKWHKKFRVLYWGSSKKKIKPKTEEVETVFFIIISELSYNL
jgi:hypothetical protein